MYIQLEKKLDLLLNSNYTLLIIVPDQFLQYANPERMRGMLAARCRPWQKKTADRTDS